MRRLLIAAAALCAASGAQAEPQSAALDRTPVEALTAQGDKVLLHPNGRWEFVDAAKAAAAQKTAALFPENKVRPVDAQGGWIPGTRTIMPGDAEYNRGSLNPKMR